MAKASRIAATTANTLQQLSEQVAGLTEKVDAIYARLMNDEVTLTGEPMAFNGEGLQEAILDAFRKAVEEAGASISSASDLADASATATTQIEEATESPDAPVDEDAAVPESVEQSPATTPRRRNQQ